MRVDWLYWGVVGYGAVATLVAGAGWERARRLTFGTDPAPPAPRAPQARDARGRYARAG